MDKIIILSCTNRPNSNTLKVSRIYERLLKTKNADVEVLDFGSLPRDIAFSETFGNRSDTFASVINQFISTQNKFVFVAPEYNGSFPGILKTFLDSVHPREWANKKACLVGVSDGRAGNLRGMDHLTGVLHYLKMHVLHNKLPISMVGKILDSTGSFNSESQIRTCEAQMDEFLAF
jgi:chromate reductase, NAD(P)H dehydrogenase (quinone)